MSYLYLLIAIAAEVIGTTMLKSSNGFTVIWPSVATVFAYGLAFYMLSLCMRIFPTGVIYAVWSGVGIVGISVLAYFVHKQKLDLPAISGIALILAGVLVIKLFSKTVA